MSRVDTRFRVRYGYTIRDLFAVMVVLSILFALVVPGLHSQRTPNYRSQCRNNLKQMGLALHNYESIYNRLPPAGHGIDESSLASRLEQGLAPIEVVGKQSIFTHMLDFIEGGTIVANYDRSRAYNDPQVKRCSIPGFTAITWNQYAAKQDLGNFRCPANPFYDVRDPEGYGMTDYMPITYTDIDPKTDPRGVVGTRNRATTASGCFALTGTRFSDIADGMGNTIMIAESAGRLPETSLPYMSGEFSDPMCTPNTTNNDACTKSGRRAFWRWAEPTSAGGISGQRNQGVRGKSVDSVSGNKTPLYGGSKRQLAAAQGVPPPAEGTTLQCLWTWTNCGPNDEIFSWHNASAQAVYADASVHSIQNDIDPVVLRQLLSRHEVAAVAEEPPK